MNCHDHYHNFWQIIVSSTSCQINQLNYDVTVRLQWKHSYCFHFDMKANLTTISVILSSVCI